MKKAQNIYDNETFYNEYKNMREMGVNANELLEIPVIKSMLPDLKNKTILDLGCGNGSMSRYFIEQGAKSVLAIDVSNNMINEAHEKNNLEGITYKVLGMENISKINLKFDLIFSSLAFHYIEDFDKLIFDIYNLLNEGGTLLFSQEHPIVTSTIYKQDMKKYTEIDNKRYFFLSDYNLVGERKIFWNVDGVIKYHRNFSSIANTIIKNGLVIQEINESDASDSVISVVEKYKYQKDRPYFIFIKAKKDQK